MIRKVLLLVTALLVGAAAPAQKKAPEQAPAPKPGVLKLRGYQDTDLGWPNFPQWPKPYKTFSETVSYGPESFLEKEAK